MPERVKVTKESSITFIEPVTTIGGKLDGPRAGDVYSRLHMPPRAIGLLHGILEEAGYNDVVSIVPQYNPGSKLTQQDWRRISPTDVLQISTITRTIFQSEELALEYKKRKPNGWVIIGGPHASYLPDECLEFADVVVRGEGEETLPELMMALEENGSPKGVKGTSYKEGDSVVHEPLRDLLSEEKFAKSPSPVYNEAVRKGIRLDAATTSRGCPEGCIYCTINLAYGRRYRRKPNEVNVAELKALSSNNVFIVDDNFAGRPRQTMELLGMMKEEGLDINSYTVQLRAQAGLIKGLPYALSQAGVHLAMVGIESLNDATLKEIGKKSTRAQNIEGVSLLREGGVRVHGMFMIGFDEDTPESIREILEYAKMNVDTAQFCAPTPGPGTLFEEAMEAQGRILTREYHLYDGQNVIVRPKNFTPDELQQAIIDMYREFYSFKLFGDKVKRTIFGGPSVNRTPFSQTLKALSYDLGIRAFAWSTVRSFVNNPQTRRHRENLKAWS